MSRVQLALNVSDLDAAIEFYSKLFATAPAKVKPGYANFAVTDPPLKLILVEGGSQPGTLNHIGVEVESRDAVAAANAHFQSVGLVGAVEEDVTCCYAVQDKVWVDGPDNLPWEFYTVLSDSDTPNGDVCAAAPESAARCC